MSEKNLSIEAIIPVKVGDSDVDPASPVGFRNVYEDGDEWRKVRGCEGCSGFCCGNCPQLMKGGGCALHARDPDLKPLYCIVKPTPNTCLPNCLLVFECVKGTNRGKFRHLTDRDEPFRNPE